MGSGSATGSPVAGTWRVIGASVPGDSHLRVGRENQDALSWFPAGGIGSGVVASVADGHGSPKSFRSAVGAKLAVDVSRELAEELLAAELDRTVLSQLKDRMKHDIPRRVVRHWRAEVGADLAKNPFTDSELDHLHRETGRLGVELVQGDPHLAYGSTLVTAIATEAFMAFWQIGDGDVLTVSVKGETGRPLPGDERLIANETTSLCSASAARLFRVGLFGTPAPLIILSTDGLANSFRDDDGFNRFGSDVLRMLTSEGIERVVRRLHGWLDEITKMGSGDDISLAIVCRPGSLSGSSARSAPTVVRPLGGSDPMGGSGSAPGTAPGSSRRTPMAGQGEEGNRP